MAALAQLLPGEDLVYFGDTGRVPYGNKSRATIERYARQDAAFLTEHNVKLIIAACGTVSSTAAHIGRELPVPFLGVVEPTADAAVAATRNRRIGVIGTAATVHSGAYETAIHHLDPTARVFSQPCQLFVQLVEEGLIDPDDPIPTLVCERYLTPLKEQQVDTLILGCTHFPLLRDVISRFMGPDVTLIDSGRATAERAAALLSQQGLLNARTTGGACAFFVSDRTDAFSEVAGRFLGRPVEHVTKIVWE